MQRSCFTVKISLMFTSSNKNKISYIAHNEYKTQQLQSSAKKIKYGYDIPSEFYLT